MTSQEDSVTSLEDVSFREDVLPNADERSAVPSEEEVADSKPSAPAAAPEEQ